MVCFSGYPARPLRSLQESVQPLVAISVIIFHITHVNLPNSITLSRLVLTAAFVGFATLGQTWTYAVATVLFITAAISDFLDGYLARKLDLVTPLGKLLDPLADKILVCAAFVFLTAEGLCPVWITCLIIGREFLVTGLRQIALEANQVLAADRLGKWKTIFQLTYLISSLIWVTLQTVPELPYVFELLQILTTPSGNQAWLTPISLALAIIFTLVSGWNYLWSSRYLLKS